jgi:cation transport regulator ChaC
VLVFPEQHPLQQQERVTWADVANYPFISLQGQFTERLLRDMHGSFRDLSLNPYNEVTFMTTALAMVSANLGITACLPYAEPMVKLYRLQMRTLHEPELTRRFFVYTKTGRSLSPAAESFMAFLFKYVETHEWNVGTNAGAREALPAGVWLAAPYNGASPLSSCAMTQPAPPDLSAIDAATIAINRRMNKFDGHAQVWLFGYGSLIYKADFPYIERRPASIEGWTRRFWQGSHDHRGTPMAPGRVATLVPQAGAVRDGMAYLITPEVFAHLDHREKNGYLRLATEITFEDGSKTEGLVYIANEENAAFLGAASELDIARQIARSNGPSGPNSDYLLHLASALRELGKSDPHVFAIEQHLAQIKETTAGGADERAHG